jgi:hypothetical protein
MSEIDEARRRSFDASAALYDASIAFVARRTGGRDVRSA